MQNIMLAGGFSLYSLVRNPGHYPTSTFLRLFRAGIIAYRLYELGYKVVPDNIRIKAMFYYSVIMEELSDRVVITVIDGIRQELETSSTHKKIIHDL